MPPPHALHGGTNVPARSPCRHQKQPAGSKRLWHLFVARVIGARPVRPVWQVVLGAARHWRLCVLSKLSILWLYQELPVLQASAVAHG